MHTIHRHEIEARRELSYRLGRKLEKSLAPFADTGTLRVRTRRVYLLDLDLDAREASLVLEALVDPVCELGAIGALDDLLLGAEPVQILEVGFLPGVTDPVGMSVKRAAEDCIGRALEGLAYSSTMYLDAGLSVPRLKQLAERHLYNPL